MFQEKTLYKEYAKWNPLGISPGASLEGFKRILDLERFSGASGQVASSILAGLSENLWLKINFNISKILPEDFCQTVVSWKRARSHYS